MRRLISPTRDGGRKTGESWRRLARLWLSVIAYNLGNLWRRLALPRRIGGWSLTSLQQRRVKTGGRLVKHARYYGLRLEALNAENPGGDCDRWRPGISSWWGRSP